jgi:cobalt-zinc-cadmium resistance protein CzcA
LVVVGGMLLTPILVLLVLPLLILLFSRREPGSEAMASAEAVT